MKSIWGSLIVALSVAIVIFGASSKAKAGSADILLNDGIYAPLGIGDFFQYKPNKKRKPRKQRRYYSKRYYRSAQGREILFRLSKLGYTDTPRTKSVVKFEALLNSYQAAIGDLPSRRLSARQFSMLRRQTLHWKYPGNVQHFRPLQIDVRRAIKPFPATQILPSRRTIQQVGSIPPTIMKLNVPVAVQPKSEARSYDDVIKRPEIFGVKLRSTMKHARKIFIQERFSCMPVENVLQCERENRGLDEKLEIAAIEGIIYSIQHKISFRKPLSVETVFERMPISYLPMINAKNLTIASNLLCTLPNDRIRKSIDRVIEKSRTGAAGYLLNDEIIEMCDYRFAIEKRPSKTIKNITLSFFDSYPIKAN
ncbi:MAG: hypothetical protein ABJK43_08805 [Lentilitoribacter sp.]